MRVCFALLALVVLCLSPYAKSYYLSDVDVGVWVNGDGSFDVAENLTFSFSGQFSYAYRDIPLISPGGQEIELFDIKVYEGGNELPIKITTVGNDRHIGWEYSAENEKRTFSIRYSVRNQIVRYDDVADFYWKFYGERTSVHAENARSVVYLPEGAEKNSTLAWGHGPDNGVTTIGDGVVVFTVSDVPPRTFIEGRVVFPSELISDGFTVNKEGIGLQRIIDDERENFEAKQEGTLIRIAPFVPLIMPVLLAVVMGVLWYRYGREPKVSFDQKYFHEPPYEYPPAVLGTLMDAGTKKPNTDGFTATIIDLAQRGYIKIEEVERKKGMLDFFKSNKDIKLKVKNLPDDKLRGYERMAFKMIFGKIDRFSIGLNKNSFWYKALGVFGYEEEENHDAIGDLRTTSVTMGELLKSSGFRRDFRVSFKRWQEMVEEFGNDHLFHEERASRIARYSSWTAGILIFASFAMFMPVFAFVDGSNEENVVYFMFSLFVSIGASIFISVYGNKAIQQRTPKGALHYAKWEAFKRFISDMTLLKEYSPSSVVMWDRYLVYATALGCADKVIEAMKVRLSDNEYRPTWFTAGSVGTLGSLSSLNSSFNSFSSTAGASGSGGSFGGGGGGGGGGGAGAG
ncbi:MAG: DUF2207 domain-containing protein [Candidatus Micrarchaeota archaeon]